MQDDEYVQHIKRLPTDREDLLIYEVDGHMTSDDILGVYTELLATYKTHDKIDLMVVLKNFEGFDWAAIWSDTTLAAKTQSLKHIRRYAIVGAPIWMRTIINVFDPLFTVQMEPFDIDQQEEALAWLNEKMAA